MALGGLATTLQFPSNGEAIADGVEKKVAEAAARAMAATIGWRGRMKAGGAFFGRARGLRIRHNMRRNIG